MLTFFPLLHNNELPLNKHQFLFPGIRNWPIPFSRVIVDQSNMGEKGAVMGLICRGWDVDDLEFVRACLQRKTSCSTAG